MIQGITEKLFEKNLAFPEDNMFVINVVVQNGKPIQFNRLVRNPESKGKSSRYYYFRYW
jgi:hypothetical protein